MKYHYIAIYRVQFSWVQCAEVYNEDCPTENITQVKIDYIAEHLCYVLLWNICLMGLPLK